MPPVAILSYRQRNVTGICDFFCGFYAAQSGRLMPTFRDNLSVPSSRTAWLFKMVSTDCPETSVGNYNYMLRKIPKDRICHLHLGGSLTSLTDVTQFDGRVTNMNGRIFQPSSQASAIFYWWDWMIGDRAFPACEADLPIKIWGSHNCKYED